MAKWQSSPIAKAVVTHAAVPYTFDAHAPSMIVRRVENGFDTATIVLEDTQSRNYSSFVDADDTVVISQKNRDDAAWTTLLSGIIRRVDPLRTLEGNFLKVECDGAGWGVDIMSCADEYGTESSNPTLDTVKTIIDDNGNGIIDAWTNEIFNTAVASGHNYTTAIEAIAGSIAYLYFPYKPCSKAIRDVCDIVQAIKGAAAGPHWIVDTSDRFLLTTVGAHSVAGDNPAQYWPTWWRTNQARSTLVEGIDFTEFRFQKLSKEANYVLYYGRFQRPTDGDQWTEGNHAQWGAAGGAATVTSNATSVVGALSIDCSNPTGGTTGTFYYPSTQDWAFDLTKFGGDYNPAEIHFYANLAYAINVPTMMQIRFWTSAGNYYRYSLLTELTGMGAGTWKHFIIPVGTALARNERWGNFVGWSTTGAPNWANINAVEFAFTVGGAGVNATSLLVDGLYFTGHVLRGARQAGAFGAADKMKLKLITDEVAKDDTGKAGTPGTTDIGVMGRLCKAEYLRVSTTPVVGTFTTSIANDLLPGQLIHVHAKEKADGTFNIDADFRVPYFIHNMMLPSSTTAWTVTSDVINANPRSAPTELNLLLGTMRPEFQDRQASSLKTREIDITQSILEESY